MKKVLMSLAAHAVVLGALSATSAQATPINLAGSQTNLQQIVNGLTVGGSSSVNVVTDQHTNDQAWTVASPGGAVGTIVIELAGYAGLNRFGLYDIYNPGTRLQLFDGAAGAGAGAQFSINSAGQVYRNFADTGLSFTSQAFGFYVETPDGLWRSQSTLNSDGADHMVAYQGEGDTILSPLGHQALWGSDTFLLGWEDLSSSSWDRDYNDMVVFVSGVKSVPEPTSLALFGLGLAGIGFAKRRRKQ